MAADPGSSSVSCPKDYTMDGFAGKGVIEPELTQDNTELQQNVYSKLRNFFGGGFYARGAAPNFPVNLTAYYTLSTGFERLGRVGFYGERMDRWITGNIKTIAHLCAWDSSVKIEQLAPETYACFKMFGCIRGDLIQKIVLQDYPAAEKDFACEVGIICSKLPLYRYDMSGFFTLAFMVYTTIADHELAHRGYVPINHQPELVTYLPMMRDSIPQWEDALNTGCIMLRSELFSDEMWTALLLICNGCGRISTESQITRHITSQFPLSYNGVRLYGIGSRDPPAPTAITTASWILHTIFLAAREMHCQGDLVAGFNRAATLVNGRLFLIDDYPHELDHDLIPYLDGDEKGPLANLRRNMRLDITRRAEPGNASRVLCPRGSVAPAPHPAVASPANADVPLPCPAWVPRVRRPEAENVINEQRFWDTLRPPADLHDLSTYHFLRSNGSGSRAQIIKRAYNQAYYEMAPGGTNAERTVQEARWIHRTRYVPASLEMTAIGLPRPFYNSWLPDMFLTFQPRSYYSNLMDDWNTLNYNQNFTMLDSFSVGYALLISLGLSSALNQFNLVGDLLYDRFRGAQVPSRGAAIIDKIIKGTAPNNCLLMDIATSLSQQLSNLVTPANGISLRHWNRGSVGVVDGHDDNYSYLFGAEIPYLWQPVIMMDIYTRWSAMWGIFLDGTKFNPSRFAGADEATYLKRSIRNYCFRYIPYGMCALAALGQCYNTVIKVRGSYRRGHYSHVVDDNNYGPRWLEAMLTPRAGSLCTYDFARNMVIFPKLTSEGLVPCVWNELARGSPTEPGIFGYFPSLFLPGGDFRERYDSFSRRVRTKKLKRDRVQLALARDPSTIPCTRSRSSRYHNTNIEPITIYDSDSHSDN